MKITRGKLKQLIREALNTSVEDRVKSLSLDEREALIHELESQEDLLKSKMSRRSFLFGGISVAVLAALIPNVVEKLGSEYAKSGADRARLLKLLKSQSLLPGSAEDMLNTLVHYANEIADSMSMGATTGISLKSALKAYPDEIPEDLFQQAAVEILDIYHGQFQEAKEDSSKNF